MKNRKPKLEVTREIIIIPPLVRRKPAFERPSLQLPIPEHQQERIRNPEEKTKEIELRGVWTIDI